MARAERTDPKLWEKVKKEITAGDKGGEKVARIEARSSKSKDQLLRAIGEATDGEGRGKAPPDGRGNGRGQAAGGE